MPGANHVARPPLVDLHVHVPMALPPLPDAGALERADATLLRLARRGLNDAGWRSGPRVSLEDLAEAGVVAAVSVLCLPLLEFGDRFTRRYSRRPPYGAPPRSNYREELLRQVEAVEAAVSARSDRWTIARAPQQLRAALASGRGAVIHCLEGGFALGGSEREIRATAALLARHGVAYITLAHLFWRRVATNVSALPPLSDATYRRLYPQPAIGLTRLGRAAVEAMVEEGIIIDLTHMSQLARDETLDLLDELDAERRVPVLASHACFRFGAREYALDRPTIERIAERDGLIGLILSQPLLCDGLHTPRNAAGATDVLVRHIQTINEITGTHRHMALGTDLDGFIKPTLQGFDTALSLRSLPRRLAHHLGDEITADVCAGNALRVLASGARWAETVGDRATSRSSD